MYTQPTLKFDRMTDWDKLISHAPNFTIQLFRCIDSKNESMPVNILHASTNLIKIHNEIDTIIQFMKDNKYNIEEIQSPDVKNTTIDVAIMGDDAAFFNNNYLFVMSTLWEDLGLVPNWDILWYGIDYAPRPKLPIITRPICSGPKFSQDGIVLVKSHINRRHDYYARIGLLSMTQAQIEHMIKEITKKDIWRYSTMIKKLKKKIKKDQRWGVDAELFFAAMDIINHIRNEWVHIQFYMSLDNIRDKEREFSSLLCKFDDLAIKNNRSVGLPSPLPSKLDEEIYVVYKHIVKLAYTTLMWITRYSICDMDPAQVQAKAYSIIHSQRAE